MALTAGINLLGFPHPVSRAATLSSLAQATNARCLVQFGALSRKIGFLPDFTPDRPIESGRGYLIVVPADVTPSLPVE